MAPVFSKHTVWLISRVIQYLNCRTQSQVRFVLEKIGVGLPGAEETISDPPPGTVLTNSSKHSLFHPVCPSLHYTDLNGLLKHVF